MITLTPDGETILKWIRDNPHVALCEVVAAHEAGPKCKCIFEEIAPLVKDTYADQFEQIKRRQQ